MMRVRCTPATWNSGGTKIFEVVSAEVDTVKQHLTLIGRDGKVCVELVGSWEVAFAPSPLLPMSIDEIERVHNGQTIVTVN